MNRRTGYDDRTLVKGYLLEIGQLFAEAAWEALPDKETGLVFFPPRDTRRDLKTLRTIFGRGGGASLDDLWLLLAHLGRSGVEGVEEGSDALYRWLNGFDEHEDLKQAFWRKLQEVSRDAFYVGCWPPKAYLRQPLGGLRWEGGNPRLI